MPQSDRLHDFMAMHRQRAGRVYETIARQPTWLTKLAVVAFMLMIVLPLVAFIIAAAVVMGVLIVILAAANAINLWARERLGRIVPRRDGRENVRVIRRV